MAFQPMQQKDRLDPATKRVLPRTYWEAGHANQEVVMPHHLLLALVATDEVWAHRTLAKLGIDSADLVRRIEAAAPPQPGPRRPQLSDGAAFVELMTRAGAVAAVRNCASIRGDHLLLAIAAGEGVGATVLTAVGATPERIREILDRMSD
jgi:ATP-dependent Clp protease ATP-binding subunit ClpA